MHAKVCNHLQDPELNRNDVSPIGDHYPNSGIDLVSCKSVVYQMKKDTPDVRVVVPGGDEETWNPFMKTRQ